MSIKHIAGEEEQRQQWEQRRAENPFKCSDRRGHHWLPVSITTEPETGMPDTYEARVFYVCSRCPCYTFRLVEWVGYMLGEPQQNRPRLFGQEPFPSTTSEMGGWRITRGKKE